MQNTTVYTRVQYMQDSQLDGPAAHRRYYGQFVTNGTKQRILSWIGIDRLLKATDPHFNDIPLKEWDHLTKALPGSAGFAKAGDYYTLSNGVCLAKEAARQIVENHRKVQ